MPATKSFVRVGSLDMDDLAKLITSPSWWVSSIVVAFLVNVAAAYVKPVADRLVSSWSQKRRFRVREEKERNNAVVMFLIDNPQRLVDIRTDAIYTALRIVLALSLAVFWTSIVRFIERYFPIYPIADVLLAAVYLHLATSALRQFKRFRGLRRVIDKCSQAIYSYDEMPVHVVQELKEQAEST
jgi:hypothetical protein